MSPAGALALAVVALVIGVGIGHLAGRRHRRAAAAAAERAIALERAMSRLRHDVRGALSPALLAVDRLTLAADPVLQKNAAIVVGAIERASAILDASRPQNQAGSVAPPPGGP